MYKYSFVSSVVVLFSACGGGGVGIVKKTAAVDLNCSAKKLDVDQLDKSRAGSTFEVHGCGRTAQYSLVKKTVTRTSEVTDDVPPAPVVAETPPPPPHTEQPQPQGFTPEQQAAFFAAHNQQMANMQANRDAFFANNGMKPAPSVPAPQSAPAQTPAAEPAPAPSEQPGWVCINQQYYTCPTAASTMALGAYAKCKMTCMMSGKCGSCVVGEGEKCERAPQRDAQCPK